MKRYYLAFIDMWTGRTASPGSPAGNCIYISCSKKGAAHGVQYETWREVQARTWKEACDKADRECGTIHSYGGKKEYR